MKVGLIACSARKEEETLSVEKMYAKSPLFRYSVIYSKKNYNAVYALSAKHGLLPLTDVIEPYDENLMNMHGRELKDWYRLVTEQILETIPQGSELYFHAGNKYRRLISFLEEKYKCEEPMKGITIGKQLKFYKEKVI
jgi:hypothetical protein